MRKRTPSQPDNLNSQTTPDVPSEQPVRKHRGTQYVRRMNPVARIVNHWIDRLMGAVSDKSLNVQEAEYASGRTSRDYICNTIGVGAYGMAFPLLTVIVTQLVGAVQAGMFSLAYVAGAVLMTIGNYGARAYQVSDINEDHSFADYQLNRWLTCIAMILAGVAYCAVRQYDPSMLAISMGVYFYKMFDALGDVYEGRLQQSDKLYLGGISQAIRSVCVVVVFTILLFITHTLAVACIGMAIAAAFTFFVVTLPLAHFETPKSNRIKLRSVGSLFVNCFPLFLALFLYTVIDYVPVFAMESLLSYDNELYYNSLYFPAQFILLAMGVVYKPLLVRLSNIWADASKRRQFDLITLGIIGIIAVFTALVIVVMRFIGIPIMSFLYGIDYEQFRGLSYIFIVAGGLSACIDFLYHIITILRRQHRIMKLYAITMGFSLFVPILLVTYAGLPGAVISYLIVMCVLFFLIVWEYMRIRAEISTKGDLEDQEEAEHLRPSEIRAERQRHEHVHEKWGTHSASNTHPSDHSSIASNHTREADSDFTPSGRHTSNSPIDQAGYSASNTSQRPVRANRYTRSTHTSRMANNPTRPAHYGTENTTGRTANSPVRPARNKRGAHGRTPSASEDSDSARPGQR